MKMGRKLNVSDAAPFPIHPYAHVSVSKLDVTRVGITFFSLKLFREISVRISKFSDRQLSEIWHGV